MEQHELRENGEAATSRARLEAVIDRLALRAARREPGRLQLLVGAVAVPTGLCMIVLGWLGAARTFRDYQQLPYLISGGLLGLGVVIAGAVSLVGYWASNILSVLVDLRGAPRGTGESAPEERWDAFVMTPTGTQFHRRGCRVVSGRTDLHPVVPSPSMAPCRICDPMPSVAGAAHEEGASV